MKEEKYAKKIKSKEKSNPAKETKKSSSKKVTENKSVERTTRASEQVVKPDTQKQQSSKSPTYNAATMLQNANKEMLAKKRRRNTAIGVTAGILLATAIIVPAVYLNGKVDINVSVPALQQDESFSVVVKRGFKVGDLQPKEIEGYTFEGFYKDANLTERYSDDDKITKDITIYAKYTANVYAITFPSSPYFTIEGEDIENNKAYAEYDSNYSFRVELSAGYTESDIHVYLGETELIPVDGVYTITIKGDSTINITGVEINTYSVVYYDEDAETIIHSEEVDYNTASTYTDTPKKPADNTYTYTFSGWVYYDSGEPITDELTHVINNIKVKASYTATYIEYSIGNIPTQVTIQKGDQTLTSTDTLHYGDTVDISYTPTTGYDMTSFNVSGATLVSGDTYRITGNLTVTYTETIQIYTITIESNNTSYGTVDEATLSIPYGTTYQVEGNDLVFSNGARVTPTPASSDAQYTYTFTGWSETSGTITGEETLTAIFAREYVEYSINNPYTQVTIKRDGETLTSESTIHYGDELEITYTPTSGYEMTTFTVTGADRVEETDTYTVTGNLVVVYAEELIVSALTDFKISDGTVLAYTGTSPRVVIPSSYSIGGQEAIMSTVLTRSDLLGSGSGSGSGSASGSGSISSDELTALDIMELGGFYATPNGGERTYYNNIDEWESVYNGDEELLLSQLPIKIEPTYQLVVDLNDNSNLLYNFTFLMGRLGKTFSCETNDGNYISDLSSLYDLQSWISSLYPDSQDSAFPLTVTTTPVMRGILVDGDDYAVIGIGRNAFQNNTNITSIELPSSISDIGDYAFSGCSSLTSITIPENVTSIGERAFFGCTQLRSVNIPESIVNLGVCLFEDCDNLETITYSATNYRGPDYDNSAVALSAVNPNVTIVITNNVKSIPNYFLCDFYQHTSASWIAGYKIDIKEIIFEEGISVDYIGDGAFYDCDILTDIPLAEGSQLTTIGTYTFYDCISLTSITIPSSVTSIGEYAFNGCSNLTTVIFGEGSQLTSIGEYAFSGCRSLTSITIPEGVTSIGGYAFYGCSGLTRITIPENVTSIGDRAFSSCTSLTSITIPEKVTSIGYETFYDCISLTDVYYSGDINDWVSISFGGYDANPLNNGGNLYLNGDTTTPVTEVNIDTATTIGAYSLYGLDGLTKVTIGDQVTTIGNYAFYNCTGLTSITIPENVTSIGTYAFYNCTGLTEINFNATNMSDLSSYNYVFYNAGKNGSGITVNIGANVTRIPAYLFEPRDSFYSPNIVSVNFEEGSQCTEIGESAFYDCSSLTSITIPETVTSIGDNAFTYCSSLTDVYYGGDINDWVSISFGDNSANPLFYGTNLYLNGDTTTPLSGEINIDTATIIGACSLYSLGGLTKVTIGDQVTSIGEYAFYGCSSLTSITIPENVTSIGDYAFYDCSSLTTVTFGENSQLESIGDYAFSSCSSLTSIELPSGITSIGSYAFYFCIELTNITIPSSVTSIGERAFDACNLEYNIYDGGLYLGNTENPYVVLMDTESTDITEFTIPSGSKIIYDGAFSGCSTLTNITIPEGVTSIGRYAFSGCSGLTRITIPENVTSIGDRAFYGCSSLTSITIPENVISIGNSAFEKCSSLTNITIPSSVTSIGRSAFYGCSSLTSVTFENTSGWYRTTSSTATSGTRMTVTDPAQNATYLKSTYSNYYWKRNA